MTTVRACAYLVQNLTSLLFVWCVHASGGEKKAELSGVGGYLGVNCGTGVRASISKPAPIIYLAFEKTDPFIY